MGQEYIRNSLNFGGIDKGSGVLLFDDCETTLNWSKSGTGGDDVCEISDTKSHFQSKSLHIKTRTTDAADNDYIKITKMCPISKTGIVTARCFINFPDISNVEKFIFNFTFGNTINRYEANFSYRPNVPDFNYYNAAGTETDINELKFNAIDNAWLLFEASFDILNNVYNSVSINNIKKELTDIPLYDKGAYALFYASFSFWLYATAEAPAEAYIDNISLREYTL